MVDYSVVSREGTVWREGEPGALGRVAERLAEGECLWVDLGRAQEGRAAEVLEAVGLGFLGPGRGRPKVDRVGDAYLIVVKTLWYVEETRQVETGDLVIRTDGRVVVSALRGGADPVSPVRERLAADAALRAGGEAVVYALLDRVVEDYAVALEALEDVIEDLEREVFSESRREVFASIYSLIRETLEFRDAVRPLDSFANEVGQGHSQMPLFSRPGFRDLAGRLLRVEAEVETCMSLLTTVLSAHQGQIGAWQNEDMRKISAWAALALVPTVIAGIYGMDFEHVPERSWVFAYPLVLFVIVVLCLLLHRAFKRSGWL